MPRTQQYRKPDGTLSLHRSDAIVVTGKQVLDVVFRQIADWGLGSAINIPQSYWLGTADHESGFAVNELDTEEDGFQSYGIFQVSKDEALEMRLDHVDLLTLESCVAAMIRLADRARKALRAVSGRYFGDDPDPPDMPAYLAIAHNLGLLGGLKPGEHVGAVVSVLQHGLDWAGPGGYKERNPGLRIVTSGYGDDCLTAHL